MITLILERFNRSSISNIPHRLLTIWEGFLAQFNIKKRLSSFDKCLLILKIWYRYNVVGQTQSVTIAPDFLSAPNPPAISIKL